MTGHKIDNTGRALLYLCFQNDTEPSVPKGPGYLTLVDGWMACDFMSLFIVFQLYQDDG